MGCCGVARTIDPETYLRLSCERTLLSQDRRNPMVDGFEAAVISRALVAAGTLDQETAQGVLDEYGFAMALRDPQRGRMLMHRGSWSQASVSGSRRSGWQLATGEFGHGNKRWTLERVLFADDATHVDLSGTGSPGGRWGSGTSHGLRSPARRCVHLSNPIPRRSPSQTIRARLLRVTQASRNGAAADPGRRAIGPTYHSPRTRGGSRLTGPASTCPSGGPRRRLTSRRSSRRDPVRHCSIARSSASTVAMAAPTRSRSRVGRWSPPALDEDDPMLAESGGSPTRSPA